MGLWDNQNKLTSVFWESQMEKRRKWGLNKYLKKLRLKASHIWRRYGASDSGS